MVIGSLQKRLEYCICFPSVPHMQHTLAAISTNSQCSLVLQLWWHQSKFGQLHRWRPAGGTNVALFSQWTCNAVDRSLMYSSDPNKLRQWSEIDWWNTIYRCKTYAISPIPKQLIMWMLPKSRRRLWVSARICPNSKWRPFFGDPEQTSA